MFTQIGIEIRGLNALSGCCFRVFRRARHSIQRQGTPPKREGGADWLHAGSGFAPEKPRRDFDHALRLEQQHEVGGVPEVATDQLKVGHFRLEPRTCMTAIQTYDGKFTALQKSLGDVFQASHVFRVQNELRT